MPGVCNDPLRRPDLRAAVRAAPVATLWQVWTVPAARAVRAEPAPGVAVEFMEADTRPGGREISPCRVEGQPDIRCETGWLDLRPAWRSVNYEVVSSDGIPARPRW